MPATLFKSRRSQRNIGRGLLTVFHLGFPELNLSVCLHNVKRQREYRGTLQQNRKLLRASKNVALMLMMETLKKNSFANSDET